MDEKPQWAEKKEQCKLSRESRGREKEIKRAGIEQFRVSRISRVERVQRKASGERVRSEIE